MQQRDSNSIDPSTMQDVTPSFPMNWSALIRIRRWTPLEQTDLEVVQIRDVLFRLDYNCYAIVVEHDASYQSDSRRIISLLWAESEGAARRAMLMEIETDEIRQGERIPREMLLPGAHTTYGSIISGFKAGKHG